MCNIDSSALSMRLSRNAICKKEKAAIVSRFLHIVITAPSPVLMSFQCCVLVPLRSYTSVVAADGVCMENVAHWVCLCPSVLSPRCRRAGEVDPRLRGNYPPSHPSTPGM